MRIRALPFLCAVAAAGTAAAETVNSADLDGDGKVDTVRIEPTGAVVVELAKGGGAFVPFGLSGPMGNNTLSIGGKGRPYVVATVQIGASWEAVALRWDKGAMREVWRGPVGPAGDDGEYEVWIEAIPAGLVRWQHRRDLNRCDGRPAELFREGWDETSRSFKPARPSVRFPDGMRDQVVVAAPSTAVNAGWYRAAGATTAAGAGDASQLVAPRALDDGDPATAWREDRGGDGTGEMFTFRTTMKGGRAAAVRIVLGAATAARGAAAGNRVTALGVIGHGAAYQIVIPATASATEAVVAILPATIDGCVSIAILAVDKRGTTNTTSIAELGVIADVELAPGGAETMLAQQVAKGGITGDSAARALAARGVAAVIALTDALEHADSAARPRLLAALARIHHPGVVKPVAEALASGDLPDGDRVAAAELLASLGSDGRNALFALASGTMLPWPSVKLEESGRLAAARVLARTEPAALLAAAGRGSRGFRTAIVGLLAGAGVAPLLAWQRDENLAPDAEPPSEAARADVWRALGKAAAQASAADRELAAQAMVTALETTAAAQYELRYRLVGALGATGSGAEIRRLVAWLGRPGDDAKARALRRVAAGALGVSPLADARQALATLAGDKDAGTRLAAVRGLATITADDTAARDAGDRALGTVLSTDAWPELRRAAASALGLRCDRRGPRDALDGALAKDVDLDVRVDALTSLVTCKSEGIAARLLRIADDSKEPPDLRDRAVALYGQLAPPEAIDALLDRLDRWRGQAFSDESALKLAVRAATALGALGDGRAASALVSAARDGAFPELQAAAAAALGALGKACPRDSIALLRALAQSEQRGVSLAARRAIETCGK